jgi:hypothetical protein
MPGMDEGSGERHSAGRAGLRREGVLRAYPLWIAVWAAVAASAAPAHTCGEMIDSLQSYIEAHPGSSGTRKQTTDAQLMHQPTRDAVAKAKKDSRENLNFLLAKAKAQQDVGDAAGCRATLADVERMLKP